MDSPALRRALGRRVAWVVGDVDGCGGSCGGRGGCGKDVSAERAEAFVEGVVVEAERELRDRGYCDSLARLVLDGLSVRECAERLGRSVWESRVGREVVVGVAERMARVWGDWAEG